APGLENEAALPAGGQWWKFFGVKLDSELVAGAEDDKTIVAIAQQLRDIAVARHFSRQSRYGHSLLPVVIVNGRQPTVGGEFLHEAAGGQGCLGDFLDGQIDDVAFDAGT